MIRRWAIRTAATIWFLLWAVPLWPRPPAEAVHRDRWPCDYHVSQGVWHRRQLIACEDRRIGAPGSAAYITGIAECESGPDLQDKYEQDGHGGPMQQATRYWQSRFETYPRKWDVELENDVTDFRTNFIVSARQAKAKGTWAADWSCA